MTNLAVLRRQKKDELIEGLVAATKTNSELSEKVVGAAVIGGVAGFLLGLAAAWG